MTNNEIKTLLSDGNFGALVGVLETEHVDFKVQPYQLTTDKQKYDLLEDVIAFANHEGGLIIFGCRTKQASGEGDVVEEIRPIPRDKLDFESYRSLVNDLIHPQVKGLSFFFYPDASDPRSGLAALEIPRASDADRPHLIAHIISDVTGRRVTTRYSLSVRTGARNSSYPVQTLHGLIKIGTSIGSFDQSIQNIERQLALLISQLEASKTSSDDIDLAKNRRDFLDLIPKLLLDTGFADLPAFVMAAFPSQRIELRDIYDGRSALSAAFDSPPELRENGFALALNERSTIVEGSVRRREVPGFKATQISISGRLIAIVRADENFLAFFQQRAEGSPIRYISFVIAEVTYIFAAYLKAIYEASPVSPQGFDMMVGLRNCFVDGVAPLLNTRRDHNPYGFSLREPKAAPKPNILKSFRVTKDISVERLAFEIRAALYHRFGFADEEIPYSSISTEGRITSTSEILNPNLQ